MASTWTATALVLLAVLPSAVAAGIGDNRQGLTFSLALSHDRAPLELGDDGGAIDTRYSRAAAELWSDGIPGIELGLTAGVGRLTQDGDPATEGKALTGESFGLLARSDWTVGEHLGFRIRAEGSYHDLDDGDLTLEWLAGYLRSGIYSRIGRWRLGAGATAGTIAGERRRPNETRDISAEDNLGAYLRLGLATDRTGAISIMAETGPRRGLTARFTRRF